MDFWWPIIISASISIIGFGVTIYTTYKKFQNSKKERIIERQSKLYLECYNKIEPIITSPQLIFDYHYHESIALFKPEMKLVASNVALRAYKEYLNLIYDALGKYNTFCMQNDPRTDDINIEISADEETGTEYEILHVTEHDISRFEVLLEKYRNEHSPSMKEVNKRIAKLLNAMRNDLSNDSIQSDIIE